MAKIEMKRNGIYDDPRAPRGPVGQAEPLPPHLMDGPVPPHLRRQMMRVVFDDTDMSVFREAFGDEDTAAAAMGILYDAPPEIQILALQILHIIEKEAV
ncbi:MAG: hypothetical protein ACSW8J_00910 [bacterium]